MMLLPKLCQTAMEVFKEHSRHTQRQGRRLQGEASPQRRHSSFHATTFQTLNIHAFYMILWDEIYRRGNMQIYYHEAGGRGHNLQGLLSHLLPSLRRVMHMIIKSCKWCCKSDFWPLLWWCRRAAQRQQTGRKQPPQAGSRRSLKRGLLPEKLYAAEDSDNEVIGKSYQARLLSSATKGGWPRKCQQANKAGGMREDVPQATAEHAKPQLPGPHRGLLSILTDKPRDPGAALTGMNTALHSIPRKRQKTSDRVTRTSCGLRRSSNPKPAMLPVSPLPYQSRMTFCDTSICWQTSGSIWNSLQCSTSSDLSAYHWDRAFALQGGQAPILPAEGIAIPTYEYARTNIWPQYLTKPKRQPKDDIPTCSCWPLQESSKGTAQDDSHILYMQHPMDSFAESLCTRPAFALITGWTSWISGFCYKYIACHDCPLNSEMLLSKQIKKLQAHKSFPLWEASQLIFTREPDGAGDFDMLDMVS